MMGSKNGAEVLVHLSLHLVSAIVNLRKIIHVVEDIVLHIRLPIRIQSIHHRDKGPVERVAVSATSLNN